MQELVEFVMIVGWLVQHRAKRPGHVLEFFGRCEMEGNVGDGNTILTGREECESSRFTVPSMTKEVVKKASSEETNEHKADLFNSVG